MKKLLVLFFVSQIVFGGSWRVSLDPTHLPDFANLQSANDNPSVVNGDTLYIAGNPATYPAATITKKLIIIGTGYFFNDNGFYNGTTNVPATIETVTFDDGSEGSLITSCEVWTMNINEKEIMIKRNKLGNIVLSELSGNLIFIQNFIYNIGVNGVFTLNNVVIKNNYIWYLELRETNNTLVSNNTIGRGVYGSYFVFHNNILFEPSSHYYVLTDCDVRNNIVCVSEPEFDTALGNLLDVNMEDVFISLTEGSQDGRYQLKIGSPAIGAGINGVDCGMYGGDSPYQLSGLPAIPIIYEMIVPAVGTIDDGINITIKARTNN